MVRVQYRAKLLSLSLTRMTNPFSPLSISIPPASGSISRTQTSNSVPILSCYNPGRCCTNYRTRSTLRILRSQTFVDSVCRSAVEGCRTPGSSFQVSNIRSSVGRRHHRRRDDQFSAHWRSRQKPEGPDKAQFTNKRRDGTGENVVITLDVDELKHRAADAVVGAQRAAGRSVEAAQRAAERSVDKAVHFARAAAQESGEVWRELCTSVRVQKDKQVVISIRRSSLEFAGKAFVGSILLVVFTKLLVDAMRRYRWGWEEGFGRSSRVVRDRSLGGKEVAVNKGVRLWEGGPVKKAANITRASRGPLDIPLEDSRSEKELLKIARARGQGVSATKKAPRLPRWWPDPDLPPSIPIASRQRAEQEALRLVQGIMQKRLSGFDFSVGDILQLRQLCKAAGAKVKFDTYNTRDSFYRAAINVVLSACQGAGNWSTVEFGREGGIGFIAGLAANIGLESDRAATMVNAAVAARTRASLLQARALHMQSKLDESKEELLKLIQLHSCFPPDPNSAEMEMVARGLGSHFHKEGRVEMLQLYEELGGAKTRRVAEEALGLLLTS